jgi:Domain of unknown function (DUF4260)
MKILIMSGGTMTNPTQMQNTTLSLPRILLHLEGAGVFVASIILFLRLDLAWWLYPLLLLVPDVSVVGYLLGPVRGAWVYNIGHLYVVPITLGLIALFSSWTLGIGLALIWLGHIGMDRMLGYGFKYPTYFKDTHFSRL